MIRLVRTGWGVNKIQDYKKKLYPELCEVELLVHRQLGFFSPFLQHFVYTPKWESLPLWGQVKVSLYNVILYYSVNVKEKAIFFCALLWQKKVFFVFYQNMLVFSNIILSKNLILYIWLLFKNWQFLKTN